MQKLFKICAFFCKIAHCVHRLPKKLPNSPFSFPTPQLRGYMDQAATYEHRSQMILVRCLSNRENIRNIHTLSNQQFFLDFSVFFVEKGSWTNTNAISVSDTDGGHGSKGYPSLGSQSIYLREKLSTSITLIIAGYFEVRGHVLKYSIFSMYLFNMYVSIGSFSFMSTHDVQQLKVITLNSVVLWRLFFTTPS